MRFAQELEDLRKAHEIALTAWGRFLPPHAKPQEIAKVLGSACVPLACSHGDFRQYIFKLDQDRRLGTQLATLATAEGCVRDLAITLVDKRADISAEKLRKRLEEYHTSGLPDRFRSLIEGFAASVQMKRRHREAWDKLIDYRNWLAHGRKDVLPRVNIPTEEDLDKEIDAALKILRAAVYEPERGRPQAG